MSFGAGGGAAWAAVSLSGREHAALAAHCAGKEGQREGSDASDSCFGIVVGGALDADPVVHGFQLRSETQEVTLPSAPRRGSALGSQVSSQRVQQRAACVACIHSNSCSHRLLPCDGHAISMQPACRVCMAPRQHVLGGHKLTGTCPASPASHRHPPAARSCMAKSSV